MSKKRVVKKRGKPGKATKKYAVYGRKDSMTRRLFVGSKKSATTFTNLEPVADYMMDGVEMFIKPIKWTLGKKKPTKKNKKR